MNDGSGPYRILFVCTANICRSPSAEAIARKRYGEDVALFRSAGFLRSGDRPPTLLATALDELDVDVTQHRSNVINEQSIVAADLVLTMEGEHVQRATLLHPESFPKIMPLKEAADVITRNRSARLEVADLIELIRTARDPGEYLSTLWDVPDPFNRKLKEYRRAVRAIAGLVDAVIGRLD